jgi:hypothetical protein
VRPLQVWHKVIGYGEAEQKERNILKSQKHGSGMSEGFRYR